jgi:glutathione reductase (NADPH)
MAFVRNVFGGDASAKPDFETVATAVFSSPPISTVGMTEEQAVEKYGDVDVYTSSFRCEAWPVGRGGGANHRGST